VAELVDWNTALPDYLHRSIVLAGEVLRRLLPNPITEIFATILVDKHGVLVNHPDAPRVLIF
jgi:hypothetical protein